MEHLARIWVEVQAVLYHRPFRREIGASASDGDVMWLVSCFGTGETGNKGFTQCEFDVGGDGHGWTVGGWSITQKGNFKRLGEEFMPKYGFPPDICSTVSSADSGNGRPSRGAIDSVVERLTNKSGANPDADDVKKFIQATTDMFASTWYATVIGIINTLGIKTRIGMATIIRAVRMDRRSSIFSK